MPFARLTRARQSRSLECMTTRDPAPPRRVTPETSRSLAPDCAWVDVRDERDFSAGHLPNCGNLPLSEWTERRHECPPHGTPLLVVAGDVAHAREAATRLAAAGHTGVAWLDAPWDTLGVPATTGPPARLWRPAEWLEQALVELPAPPGGAPRGRALDIACGTGRDAVFLGMAGFDVEAWDRDAAALSRARELARRHEVSLRTLEVELESEPDPIFETAAFALVACFRYLHRPLFPAMARALAPGGVLVYETYRQGQERFGKPRRPRFLLRAGELREAFAGLEVVRYEEPSPPEGPWTARIVARRGAG